MSEASKLIQYPREMTIRESPVNEGGRTEDAYNT